MAFLCQYNLCLNKGQPTSTTITVRLKPSEKQVRFKFSRNKTKFTFKMWKKCEVRCKCAAHEDETYTLLMLNIKKCAFEAKQNACECSVSVGQQHNLQVTHHNYLDRGQSRISFTDCVPHPWLIFSTNITRPTCGSFFFFIMHYKTVGSIIIIQKQIRECNR